LKDILEGEAAREVAIGAAADGQPVLSAASDADYTTEDKAVIAERLRALGYI
jgi:hypothetical protein